MAPGFMNSQGLGIGYGAQQPPAMSIAGQLPPQPGAWAPTCSEYTGTGQPQYGSMSSPRNWPSPPASYGQGTTYPGNTPLSSPGPSTYSNYSNSSSPPASFYQNIASPSSPSLSYGTYNNPPSSPPSTYSGYGMPTPTQQAPFSMPQRAHTYAPPQDPGLNQAVNRSFTMPVQQPSAPTCCGCNQPLQWSDTARGLIYHDGCNPP